MVLIPISRVYLAENSIMPDPVSNSAITIRDLTTIAELEAVLRLEKEVWGFEDADVTPLTLAVAMQSAGSITEITWTFDPLRSRNAHLNFSKLGVISDSYRPDFYGAQTSSSLHTNGTDRLWVTWRLADSRVEERLKGKSRRSETLDALALLEPLVRFNGDGNPAEAD